MPVIADAAGGEDEGKVGGDGFGEVFEGEGVELGARGGGGELVVGVEARGAD